MRIVAFTGPKGSGKNTAARILLEDEQIGSHFRHAPMAEGVKKWCNDFFGWTEEQMDDMAFKEKPIEWWPGGPILEPRWAMMDWANFLRDKWGGDIHVQRWMRHAQRIEESDWDRGDTPRCHVITDFRFPEEHQMLLEQNALIIYVARPSAEDALQRKKALGDAMALNPSEAFYDMIKAHPGTLIIPNAKEPYHLWNEVRTAVKNKYGHPIHWDQKDAEIHSARREAFGDREEHYNGED